MAELDTFYAAHALTTVSTDPNDAAISEAMYYSGYHAAKRRHCGCGWGKWIMYESKCGTAERIEHVWNQLNDSAYGVPTRFYRRSD